MIDEGKIVTSETTVDLLRDAMAACDGGAFLIDGFPRSLSNLRAFEERTVSHVVQACEGNRSRASAVLGMSRPALNRRLES